MKGFLVFCGIVVTFGLVWLALPYLDARDRAYEQRFIGALNFTEDTIEAARDLHMGIYGPSIVPGPNPGYWVVSGIMVSKDNLGGKARAPFSAVLENICDESFDLSCWRMVELAIDGQAVGALPTIGVSPETVAEGAASGGAGQDDIREEDVAPVPAVLNGGGRAATSMEPVAGAPDLAAPPVQEATESPLPEPSASSQEAATPGTNGGESPTALEDEQISKQEMIRFIQGALTLLEYEPGPIDGKLGSRTASAIRAYQRNFNLVPDGLPSVELLRHLRGQLGDLGQQSRDPSNEGQSSG